MSLSVDPQPTAPSDRMGIPRWRRVLRALLLVVVFLACVLSALLYYWTWTKRGQSAVVVLGGRSTAIDQIHLCRRQSA
jgi:hypothetical protein